MLPSDKDIIVSGKFGLFFNNYVNLISNFHNRKIIVVNGGLRRGGSLDSIDYLANEIFTGFMRDSTHKRCFSSRNKAIDYAHNLACQHYDAIAGTNGMPSLDEVAKTYNLENEDDAYAEIRDSWIIYQVRSGE